MVMGRPFPRLYYWSFGMLVLCALSLFTFVRYSKAFDEFHYIMGQYVLWRFIPAH